MLNVFTVNRRLCSDWRPLLASFVLIIFMLYRDKVNPPNKDTIESTDIANDSVSMNAGTGSDSVNTKSGTGNNSSNANAVRTVKFSEGGKQHHLWPGLGECSSFVTRFANRKSLPSTALASYPGSGNTWIRYLIEGATGIYTGSVFRDEAIAKAGHWGELRNHLDGSTILQKTHHKTIVKSRKYMRHLNNWKLFPIPWPRRKSVFDFSGRGIVVVRNPFKAILSYWNWIITRSHTGTVNQNSLNSKDFSLFASLGVSRWSGLISDWITLGKDVHFIFYEDLVSDPVSELRKLLHHLNLPVDEARLICIKEHMAGSFHRTKHQSINPYNYTLHGFIKSHIDSVNKMLNKYNMTLPLHKYQYYIKQI